MKAGSTIFLRAVIFLIGAGVLTLCVIIAGMTISGNAGMYFPVAIVMLIAAAPFFLALYQGLLLLSYIDKNIAFSELSVKAIRNITYSAFTISILYAAAMPVIIMVAEKDNAPGAVVIGLVFIFAPLVTGVFAAVLQRLLQNAIDIKKENELTI